MSDEPVPRVDGFESATELRQMHERLLESLDRELGAGEAATAEVEAVGRLESHIRTFVERGAATGVYLEEVRERTTAQVLLDYWVSTLARAGRGSPPSRLAPFDGSQAPDLKDRPCPYVGLDAFRHPDFFFGRESDTSTLVEQLRHAPLVVVMGASGSGKSSLVMGGVLPALAATADASRMRIASPMVPGNAALLHLAHAVLEAAGRKNDDAAAVAARLKAAPGAVVSLLEDDEPALLTIDQFEELFTLSDREARDAMAAALAGVLGANRGHRVILTMREEFRSRLVELRELAPFLDTAWYSMRPMGYEELRAAVERPAAAVNLQFQTGIVDDLVKKVLGQPAALPLLQFTLRTLWDRRDRNRITWEVYRRVGDPLTALQTSADAFYDALPPEVQMEAKRILLELVRVDELLEAYRQPLPKSQLLRAGRANSQAVLDVLAENDYVRITDDRSAEEAVVEVKHESLIRNWPRLVGWIDEKRMARRQRMALTQAAHQWQRAGRPPEGLLTGWQLEEARRQADLTEIEREFVEASSEQVDTERREREAALRREAEHAQAQARWERQLRRIVLAAAGATLAVIGAFVWMSYRQGQRVARLERIYLAAAASEDPLTQALLLTELRKSGESGDLQQYAQLFQDVATTPIPLAVLAPSSSNSAIVGVEFADDGQVTTVDAAGTLRLWPADGRGREESLDLVRATAPTADDGADSVHRVELVAFSSDRTWVATANVDGSIRAAPLSAARTAGGPMPVIPPLADPIGTPSAIALSENGDWLAVAGAGAIGLWTRGSDGSFQADRILGPIPPVAGLAFHGATGRLAAASWDGVIRIWTLASSDPAVEFGPLPSRVQPPLPNRVSFSADGNWIVSGYDDNMARVWRADGTAPLPLVLEGHTEAVTSAVFAPAAPGGQQLIVGTTSFDQTARLWTLSADSFGELKQVGPPRTLRGHLGGVVAIDFSLKGDRVVTGSPDGTARVWWTAPREPRTLGWHGDEVTSVGFDTSGRRVVSASWDRTAGVWSVDGEEALVLTGHDDGVRDAVFNPQVDQQVATVSQDGRLGLWDLRTVQPTFFPSESGGPALLAVAYDRAATHVAAATERHEALIWRLADGSLEGGRPLPHPLEDGEGDYWVFDVAFSPDGARLVTASGDGRARLWAVDGSLLERVLPVNPSHAVRGTAEDTRVLRAVFSPADGSIATASATAVRVFPTSGQDPWIIRLGNVVNDVAFGPGGLLLTASDDGTARVFDAANGGRILALRNGSKVRAAAFDPLGRLVVTGDVDGGVRLWRVGLQELAEYLEEATTACLGAIDRQRFLLEDAEQALGEYERCEASARRSQP